MRRAEATSGATGKHPRQRVDTDPRSLLSHLLATLRAAVARLEAEAVRSQSDESVSLWSLALRCVRELGLVAEAIGCPSADPSAAMPHTSNPLVATTRAYERALRGQLPRPVRPVLEDHLQRLRMASRFQFAA